MSEARTNSSGNGFGYSLKVDADLLHRLYDSRVDLLGRRASRGSNVCGRTRTAPRGGPRDRSFPLAQRVESLTCEPIGRDREIVRHGRVRPSIERLPDEARDRLVARTIDPYI